MLFFKKAICITTIKGGGQAMVVASLISDDTSDITDIDIVKGSIIYDKYFKKGFSYT